MAPSTSRLAVDLSTNSIRVVEGSVGGAMRSAAAALTEGAEAGKISNPAGVAQTLKALLARIEVTQTRALVAAGDALGTFRILRMPLAATPKDIDAAIGRELAFDPQRTATKWLDVRSPTSTRLIYAVSWDRALLRNVVETVKQSGLEPDVVELKSASVARAMPTSACVVIDLCSVPAELVLVDEHLPQVWHSFAAPDPLGDEAAEALAQPLRSLLRFYRRRTHGEFGQLVPVFVSADQTLPPQVLSELSRLVNQPVRALPAPPRVPGDIRHATYLACLGLLMRRGGG